jgi:ketosteroid isomerase-like protein
MPCANEIVEAKPHRSYELLIPVLKQLFPFKIMNTLIRRTSTTALLGTVALALCAVGAGAKETAKQAAAQRAISALYASADRAVVRKDLPTLMKSMAPDYTLTTAAGRRMTRAQAEEMQRMSFNVPGMTFKSCKTTLQKFEWRGSQVAVTATASALAHAQTPQQKIPIQVISQTRDVWRSTPRGWQVFQSTEIKTRTFVNGRPVAQP